MPETVVYESSVWAGFEALFLARVVNKSGAHITQAGVSTITYSVREAEGDEAATASGSLTVSEVVYNTLQYGGLWDVDLDGYNFFAALPGACFPTAGTRYRVEFVLTPTSGNPYPLVFEVTAARAS